MCVNTNELNTSVHCVKYRLSLKIFIFFIMESRWAQWWLAWSCVVTVDIDQVTTCLLQTGWLCKWFSVPFYLKPTTTTGTSRLYYQYCCISSVHCSSCCSLRIKRTSICACPIGEELSDDVWGGRSTGIKRRPRNVFMSRPIWCTGHHKTLCWYTVDVVTQFHGILNWAHITVLLLYLVSVFYCMSGPYHIMLLHLYNYCACWVTESVYTIISINDLVFVRPILCATSL